MRHGNPASITDAMQGVAMGFAGLRGGLWNVIINLKDITDKSFNQDMGIRCLELLNAAKAAQDEATDYGDQALEQMLAKNK